MNKTKIFFRNVSILFDYLKFSFKEWVSKSKKVPKTTIHNFFRIPNSPKITMYACVIFAMISALNNKLFLTILFSILYVVSWFYKIWIGGEPIKWYRDRYLVK